jgi:hypothetical protein
MAAHGGSPCRFAAAADATERLHLLRATLCAAPLVLRRYTFAARSVDAC